MTGRAVRATPGTTVTTTIAAGMTTAASRIRMVRSALVVLAVLVGTARGVRADDVREQASRAFQAGETADKHKQWAEAIEHYEEAYRLQPHPFALFNIAHDHE